MDGLKMQLSCIREIINTNLYTTPISLISRLYYIFQGAYNRETGAIQFQFHDGSILFCDVGADGEQLALSNQKWQDPFHEPLSPINQTYVQEHGKWCLVDVSIEEPYSNIIGTTLRKVNPILTQFNKIGGLLFETYEGFQFAFLCESDEGYFLWQDEVVDLESGGFTVLEISHDKFIS